MAELKCDVSHHAAANGAGAPEARARHLLLLAAGLILLAIVAYLPALHNGFIWDDDVYVTNNPLLTDSNGLKEIWFSAQTQSQYFPLVYTTLRFEHALWGLNPLGYHLVNILLHGINAALAWVVLRRLQAPGAWLAAAIFALHPVEVETVAWVAELKNVESLLFYLLALLAWMKFVEPAGPPRWHYYGLALASYLLALFAKTTACTLPAAMVLVLWVRGYRIGGGRVLQILPFIAAGLALGLITVWWEKYLGDYDESFGLAFSCPQRLLIASRALWFYADKLAWPVNLMISYPRWDINTASPLQYIPIAGCLAVACALWVWREKIGRGTIAGIIFFAAALSPLLGFIVEGSFHYTYVADHYQYIASIGLIAVFAGVAWHWLARTPFWLPLQAVLLLGLGTLTWHQCAPYRNLETLWRDTLKKNPDSWMAHHNLGIVLFQSGRVDEALEQYRQAVALYPGGDKEQGDLGTALLEKRLYPEAIQHLETALAINPKLFQAQNSLGLAYLRTGDYDNAIVHFREALQLDPEALGVFMNLGRAQEQQGKLDEAAETYRDAAKRFPMQAGPFHRLATDLYKEEKFPEASQACTQALQLAPNDPDLWLLLGNASLAQTNYETAADSYRKALQINPSSAGTHYNLGITLGLQGKTEEERRELMQALQLEPDFAPARQTLQDLDSRK